jgi:hypothetical protein
MAVALGWSLSLGAANAIWWEGETATSNDFVEAPWLKTEIIKTRLSGMDWLCCFVPRDSAEIKPSYAAAYKVQVASAGTYFLWIREFYRRGASPWRFRLNGGEWTEVTNEHPYGDIGDLGKDRSVVWCKYGPFDLAPGALTVELEVLPQKGRDVIAGLDAFLLIDEEFVPNGWKKPSILSTHEYIGTFIWCEGEGAENNFVNQDKSIPQESPKLSAGQQLVLSKIGGSGTFSATWTFTVPSDDSYHIWVRQSDYDQSSPYRLRFNVAEWRNMPGPEMAFDAVTLDRNNRACWVYHGKFFLIEGESSLTLETVGPAANGNQRLAVDAICLSLETFFPNGRHRPDATVVTDRQGWFPFQAQGDIFLTAPPVLDLRDLNEKQAGDRGHCRVDSRVGLALADGTPVRFWGVNAYRIMCLGPEEVNYFLERMAHAGVNLIRLRGPLNPSAQKTFGQWDKEILGRLHYFVAACRKQGIYVALSPYSPADHEMDRKQGFAGYDGVEAKNPYGLLFANPDFRRKYEEWTSFLAVRNPFSKLTLAEDPTIAWLELQHGDSLLAMTVAAMPKEQKQLIEDKYNQWLVARYGSEMHILRAWSIPGRYHPVVPDDGRQNARCFRLLPPEWFLPSAIDGQEQAHFRRRKMDQLRFLAGMQRQAYAELTTFLRDKRGVKCLIAPGAAPVASPKIAEAIERWTQTTGGVVPRTGSFSPLLIDAKVGQMVPGLRYQDRSALFNPLASPILNAIYAGHGNIVSEVSWPMPNGYRSEAVALIAAYSSLSGSNGCIWHEAESPGWASHLAPLTIQSPAVFGAFPGYALMYRRGDLLSGKPVVDQGINLNEQFELRGVGTDVTDEKDQAKLMEILGFQRKTYDKDMFDPALFLAGPVARTFTDKPGYLTLAANAAQCHDRRAGIIRSATGELALDYRQGLLTIDAPRAQAAVGFLKQGGPQALRDVTITIENEYANVLVISLENQPLAESKHILVQALTKEMNLGWKEERIPRSPTVILEETGEPPVLLESLRGSILLRGKRAADWQAWALNPNGRRIADVNLNDANNGMHVAFPDNAIYVELKRR